MKNFKYFMSQGFRGLVTNGLMSIASISIVTASIAIFGIFILFGINLNYISTQAIEQAELQVFIEFGTDEGIIENIGQQIEQIEGVRSVIPYSSEEQLQEALIIWADDPVMIQRLETGNIFREGFRVILIAPSYAYAVETEIDNFALVANINNDSGYMEMIEGFAGTLRNISLWLVILLGLVSIFIISNTIKLAMFARRKEIAIMKHVGATNGFIRWPFIIEGIIIGLIGGVIASGLMLWAYSAVLGGGLNNWFGPIDMIALGDIYIILLVSLLSLGGGIGIIGSVLSIRKHLAV